MDSSVTTGNENGSSTTPPQSDAPSDAAESSSNSFIQTLEPATGGEARSFNNKRQQNQNFRKQRKLRQAIITEGKNTEQTPYPKFYSLKFPRLDIEKKINVIAVDVDIRNTIGEPAEIKKQNKDTLLIKVKSQNQGRILSGVTKIADYEVDVSEHKSLNQSKGTVYSETLSNIPIEQQEALIFYILLFRVFLTLPAAWANSHRRS